MAQFVINSPEKLKEKLEMVQALGDIEIASRLMEQEIRAGQSEVDSNYEKLKCRIMPVDKIVSHSPPPDRVRTTKSSRPTSAAVRTSLSLSSR